MSQLCPLSTDSALPCLDNTSGVREICVTEVGNKSTQTISASGEITAMALRSGTKFWTFNLEKEDATATDDMTQTGLTTGVFVHQIIFTRRGFSPQQRHQLNLLRKNRCIVMTLDWDGIYQMYGWTGGIITALSNNKGKAFGEFSGSTVTFTSNEPDQAYFVNSSIVASLLTFAP